MDSPNEKQAQHRSYGVMVFLCITLLVLVSIRVIPTLALNRQMVALLHIVMTNDMVEDRSLKLTVIYDNLAKNHAKYPDQVGSELVMSAIWLDNPGEAYRWLQTYPQAWEQITFPESQWRTLIILSYNNIKGWNNVRRSAAYASWMAGFRAFSDRNYEMAVRWFQRGLVLAPGRVPEEVRLGYYRALSEWYRTSDQENLLLAQEYGCLAENRLDCLEFEDSQPAWQLLDQNGADGDILSEKWHLVGFDLDPNILITGVEVRSRLRWVRMIDGHKQEYLESFAAPNFVPNPGFEFDNLFVDACVDGYIGSHAYVQPCVSRASIDPYGTRPGHVAIIETVHKGYALLSSSFPVKGGSTYVVGGWFCADNGATAALGWDSLTDTASTDCRLSNGGSICWLIWQNSTEDQGSCWSRQLQVVKVPTGSPEVRLLLDREGGEGGKPGRAMFDNLFIFELPVSP